MVLQSPRSSIVRALVNTASHRSHPQSSLAHRARRIKQNVRRRRLRHALIRDLPRPSAIHAHADSAHVPRGATIAPHLRARQVVRSAHYAPHLPSLSGIERNPVSRVAPLLRNSIDRSLPRAPTVFTAEETNICRRNKPPLAIERIEEIAVVCGYIKTGSRPISSWNLYGVGSAPRRSAIRRNHRAAEIRAIA